MTNNAAVEGSSGVKPLPIVASGLAGMLLLGGSTALYQMISKRKKKQNAEEEDVRLLGGDHIEKYAQGLSDLYKKLVGEFLGIVPETKRRSYLKNVRESMRYAEGVIVIEVQLMKKEIKPSTKEYTEAKAYAQLAIDELKKIQTLVHSALLLYLNEIVTYVSIALGEHLISIRNLVFER